MFLKELEDVFLRRGSLMIQEFDIGVQLRVMGLGKGMGEKEECRGERQRRYDPCPERVQ